MEEKESPPIPAPRRQPPQPPPQSSDLEQEFLELHRSAYAATQEAQNLDGNGSSEGAFKGYERALQLIDKAIHLSSSSPSSPRVEELTLKMRMSRKEILERVSDLQFGRSAAVETPRSADMPPAYCAVLQEIGEEIGAREPNPLPLNAQQLFNISADVQIYFISAEDSVSAPSYPSFLRLVRVNPGGEGTPTVPSFLQVGDFVYPLIPSHSPLFRSTEGIYIFPDLSNNVPGAYVGLILPENLGPQQRQVFEETLLQLVEVEAFPPVVEPPKEKPPRPAAPQFTQPLPQAVLVEEEEESEVVQPERRFSTKIAEGLITGAERVSAGLIAGAAKTTNLIDKGAAYLQSKIEPAKDKTVVKPEVKKGMKTAKTVSGKAVQVSGYIVSQVGRATIALGKWGAPHVHKASTKFLARTVATDELDASQKVDQVMEVTTGAVVGFGTVYFGLEHAARALVSSLANNTVNIVQHRYGDDAGELAGDTAATAGNAALTAWNAKNLAPKAVAKRVAKDTGRMVIKAHQEKRDKNVGPPGPSAKE